MQLRCDSCTCVARARCGSAELLSLPYRSAERMPQDFLYLVVRKSSGQWEFPQAAHAPGETVRQARCLAAPLLAHRRFSCPLPVLTLLPRCRLRSAPSRRRQRAWTCTSWATRLRRTWQRPRKPCFSCAPATWAAARGLQAAASSRVRRVCICTLRGALTEPRSRCADWAWVTKGELTEYVGKDVQALVQQAL